MMTTEQQHQQQQAVPVVQAEHWSICCDECGVHPIIGTRYKSTQIVDYDVCHECYEENHAGLTLADAFVPFHEEVEVDEEDIFEFVDKRAVCVSGWDELESTLRQNSMVETLDVSIYNPPATSSMDDDHDDDTTMIPAINYEGATEAIANNTSLKSIHLHLCYLTFVDLAVEAFAKGIMANKSIFTVSWSFRHPDIAEQAVQSLCDLVRFNKRVRFMLFDAGFLVGAAQRDCMAVPLFQALEQTSIHSFGYRGGRGKGLLDDCGQAALHAMKTNPNLKRIKAKFETEIPELEQLMQNKKHQWVTAWNDLNASDSDRSMLLEELLSCKEIEDKMFDQVAALFHILRSNPGSLPNPSSWINSSSGSSSEIA